jgi:acetyl/propionyl-CoA carboxylase alpha subunit
MAIRLGLAAGLRNAATCEFLLDPDGAFWFLEVNTRLQVEHGVTELVAGVDIVREQFLVAAGASLGDDVIAAGARAATPIGHAIEVRIAAEDPTRAFAPTPGRVGRWVMASGSDVRVDTAIDAGDVVPPDYDNLIAKLMVHGDDRDAAIDALSRALDDTEIGGVQTTLPFHRFVARSVSFRRGDVSTGWVDANWDGEVARRDAIRYALLAAGLAAIGDGAEDTTTVSDPRGGMASSGAAGGGWRRAARQRGIDRWPA